MTIGQSTNFLGSYCNHLFLRQAASLIAAIALCLCAGSARAAPPPTVLILSVAEDGRQQDGLRTQVGELVQRAGARLAETADLSASARACEEPVCLTKIADDHRAEFVLAARIERRSRHDRLIDMWLYRAKTGTDQSERELCDVRDMKDCMSSLAGKLIGPQLEGGTKQESGAPAASTGKPPVAAAALSASLLGAARGTPQTAPPSAGRRSRLPGWRIGLGLGLGALAVGSLATAIGASALNGQAQGNTCPSAGSETGCYYDLSPILAPSYLTAAGLTVGAVLSFALPTRRLPKKENP